MLDSYNNNGGAVVVMQWTSDYIKMWLFPKNKPIPASLQNINTMPDVCEFGLPDAAFYGCNFNEYFSEQQLVFTNTFCGDYAGASGVYPQGTSQCPNSCSTQVQDNPSSYSTSYVLSRSLA
jgi:hypothetical protein